MSAADRRPLREPEPTAKRRYCEMCDAWFPVKLKDCPECGLELSKAVVYCPICEVSHDPSRH
jgi:predicted amidophosphoribosyltransferase